MQIRQVSVHTVTKCISLLWKEKFPRDRQHWCFSPASVCRWTLVNLYFHVPLTLSSQINSCTFVGSASWLRPVPQEIPTANCGELPTLSPSLPCSRTQAVKHNCRSDTTAAAAAAPVKEREFGWFLKKMNWICSTKVWKQSILNILIINIIL